MTETMEGRGLAAIISIIIPGEGGGGVSAWGVIVKSYQWSFWRGSHEG